ncbi:MAG: hypothetical protein WBE72_20965 [Terracidiphilus sp.]
MPNPQRSILAAVTLFFLAPLVAEYLLGDFPLTWLPLIIVLAPMYGGGAIVIRELARRSHRGWPTILLLGVAYAIIEEAFTTQSLFNPHYLGMHLLSHAWIPVLGTGAWWTLFMLNVHPFWSIGVSIALVDGLYPSRTRTPWLGNIGLSVAVALFAVGIIYNTSYSLHHDRFRASAAQLIVSTLLVVVFAAAAFLIPPPAPSRHPSPAPSPWIIGGVTFLLGAAVFLSPILWDWGAVVIILGVDLVFLVGLGLFSQCSAWTPLHTFSIGAAGALVYGVHAFLQGPVVPSRKWIVLASHVLFLVLALAVVAAGTRRTRESMARETA